MRVGLVISIVYFPRLATKQTASVASGLIKPTTASLCTISHQRRPKFLRHRRKGHARDPRREHLSIAVFTMIDTENLRTASLYINNQLLSRGLLRDGQSIDFANPGTDDAAASATMGRIVSVVNDLILRRDVSTLRCTSSLHEF